MGGAGVRARRRPAGAAARSRPTEWAQALGAQIAAGPPDASYYEHWLAALESLLDAKGLADADTLARCRDAWARAAARTPHGAPIELAPDDR